jgi:L-ascorbate metabolism protein UlaG (beta-lactamase superfamily)
MVRLLSMLAVVVVAVSCAPRYHGPVTNHFNGKKFINPGITEKPSGKVLEWLLHRDKGPWPEQPDAYVSPKPADRVAGDSLVVTFVNHSTFLIQTNGLNILTDPVWSDRVGPTSWLGIKRRRPPGLRIDELPHIDVVLLSHCHYDHLDLPTLRKLVKASNPLFVTPLGVSYLVRRAGGRSAKDRDKTLWAGYLLHTGYGTVYFCGDSGYGPHFKRIGQQARQSASGPIKLALLPIGSYRPEWFMAPVHVSPKAAVQALLDLNAPQALGIHFGTFQQGDDGLLEPAQGLQKALDVLHVSPKRFVVPKEGRPLVYK